MSNIHVHINDIDWQNLNPFPEHEASLFKYKELLNREQGGCEEWIFGLAEFPASRTLPLHMHRNDITMYILSGKAKVRLGARAVELEPFSGMYFPAQKPHSIASLGPDPLSYLYTYVCEEQPQTIDWELADENMASRIIIENKPETRWAVHEEFEKWEYWEPSKGSRLRYRTLFDDEHGKTREGAAIYSVAPDTHYTRHFHGDAEIYYIVSGHGIMSVEDSEYEVSPGSALYIGPSVVHGIDNIGNEPLKNYVIFGTKTMEGWTPVEDVYTEVRRDS
jgi:mannose-6-phosphate isomerase-like protein (cupin superfamily)